jgi:hypothetical protein
MTGDTTMWRSKAKSSTRVAANFALATTIAALSIATVPFAGAVAAGPDSQMSAARAKAIRECSGFIDDWGYRYRACMTEHAEPE